jgi:hypothetical protein
MIALLTLAGWTLLAVMATAGVAWIVTLVRWRRWQNERRPWC